ncbi:hypothetical protein B0J11DRAFT_514816 [Dendryphion nanum]|uniref:Uncharacterized protein n=1 Tax=Dendryphion nanum TaxID=256645 RepID=A0A9P9EHZ3_9PLEO|nr:hypothetical protein B0J11DRAFT_514816 [Dendryphion nanum]
MVHSLMSVCVSVIVDCQLPEAERWRLSFSWVGEYDYYYCYYVGSGGRNECNHGEGPCCASQRFSSRTGRFCRDLGAAVDEVWRPFSLGGGVVVVEEVGNELVLA